MSMSVPAGPEGGMMPSGDVCLVFGSVTDEHLPRFWIHELQTNCDEANEWPARLHDCLSKLLCAPPFIDAGSAEVLVVGQRHFCLKHVEVIVPQSG